MCDRQEGELSDSASSSHQDAHSAECAEEAGGVRTGESEMEMGDGGKSTDAYGESLQEEDEQPTSCTSCDASVTSAIDKSEDKHEGEFGGEHKTLASRMPVRDRVVSDDWTGVVVLCAEPNMGKTRLLSEAVSKRRERGVVTRYEDFSGLTCDETLSMLTELVKWSQNVSQQGKECFLAIDDISAGDEYMVYEQAQLVQKISDSDCAVLLSMKPEHEVLAQALAGATIFWSCDLRVDKPQDPYMARLYEELVHGIPRLADALGRLQDPQVDAAWYDPSYTEHFVDVLVQSLREQLMGEERCARICMALLGMGTYADLEELLGTVEGALWHDIARDAPFFGVDVSRGRFCCVGGANRDVLTLVFRELTEITKTCPELVAKVTRLLADKDNMLRSAMVSSMCADPMLRRRLAFERPASYAEAGAAQILKDALEGLGQEKKVPVGYNRTLGILDSIEGGKSRGKNGEEKVEEGEEVGEDRTEEARSIMAMRCRAIWYGAFDSSAGEGQVDDAASVQGVRQAMVEDEVCERLVCHEQVLKLISQGLLEEAFGHVLNAMGQASGTTVSKALIAMDYMFCSLVLGMVPPATITGAFEEARAFFSSAGYNRLASLWEAVLPFGHLLGGKKGDGDVLEAVAHRAERRGDKFLHALLLLATGVSDLRHGAYTRAHVRFEYARRAFVGMNLEVLAKEAQLMDFAARLALGERVGSAQIGACKGSLRALDDVVSLVVQAADRTQGLRQAGGGGRGSSLCPKNVYWLVNVLVHDCGAFSNRMRSVLPESWLNVVAHGTSKVEGYFERNGLRESEWIPGEEGARASMFDPARVPAGTKTKVSVSLFGGLEVRVNGVLVPTHRISRRKASNLLALLASVQGHTLNCYEVIDSVWPGYTIDGARKSIYSACTVLNSEINAVSESDESVSLAKSDKGSGTVWMDRTCTSYDVDRFDSLIRALVRKLGDDRAVVRFCQDIDDVYKGDLYVPPLDGMGTVTKRMLRLQEDFVDAMVIGTKAALELEATAIACRFAQRAYQTDDMREDVMGALVAALCASDRHTDAANRYEAYAAHVVEVTGSLPSRKLRERVEEYLGGRLWGPSRHKAEKLDVRRDSMELLSMQERKKDDETSGQMTIDFGD